MITLILIVFVLFLVYSYYLNNQIELNIYHRLIQMKTKLEKTLKSTLRGGEEYMATKTTKKTAVKKTAAKAAPARKPAKAPSRKKV